MENIKVSVYFDPTATEDLDKEVKIPLMEDKVVRWERKRLVSNLKHRGLLGRSFQVNEVEVLVVWLSHLKVVVRNHPISDSLEPVISVVVGVPVSKRNLSGDRMFVKVSEKL